MCFLQPAVLPRVRLHSNIGLVDVNLTHEEQRFSQKVLKQIRLTNTSPFLIVIAAPISDWKAGRYGIKADRDLDSNRVPGRCR